MRRLKGLRRSPSGCWRLLCRSLPWWSLIVLLRSAVDEHGTFRCPGSWKTQCTWLRVRGRLRHAPNCAYYDTMHRNEDPKTYRDRMTLIIFEIFNVRDGRRGDDVLQTVATYENYALPHAILHWDLAGCVFTVSPLSAETLSRPPKRGRSIVMSKRNFAALLSTTTQCSNRLQKFQQEADPRALRRTQHRMFPLQKCFFQPSVVGTSASGIHVIFSGLHP